MTTAPSPTFLALQAAVAGRYALERELGRGGMGVVYLARDLSLDRPVAVKLLPPSLAAVPALRERFLREARIAARLSHPHIVPIHSVEEHGEFVLFVMGYVEGETLGQRLARGGALPPEEMLRILQEVAWALAYAHGHGVVHRDVKPDNILLERATGRALVSDFGIAQAGPAESGGAALERAGTVRYMSPEQLAGGAVDGRSDLYALGVTALQAFQPELPGRVRPIIERCLQANPDDRYPDGETLAGALGDARGQRLVVPAPVERFVDLYKTLGVEIATYASVLVVLGAESLALFKWDYSLLPLVLIYALFLAVGLGGLRMIQLVGRARQLLREGFTPGDVRRALDRPSELPAPLPRVPRRVVWSGGVAAAAAWAGLLTWWAAVSRGTLVDAALFALLTLLPVVALRSLLARMMRPARRGWWSRLWWRVLDWKVFRLAGLGQRPAVAASEPTEVMLGAGARDLFASLPGEVRDRLPELPRVLERLEQQAAALRDGPGDGDRARLGSTLAAMERLRLDLLRLRAGSGEAGDLTHDLEAAEAVGRRIEELLRAQRTLADPTPVP